MNKVIISASLVCFLLLSGCMSMDDEMMKDEMMDDVMMTSTFTVRIENLSETSSVATPFAPGVFAVHSPGPYLFVDGSPDLGKGLEDLAEDGNPAVLAGAIEGDAATSGVFNTPVGESSPGPLFPGMSSYEFSFEASSGKNLSFALMFVQSNDLFFAPSDEGIDLFPNGSAISGDITSMIYLWDAGTEVNEAPGSGANQAPRQAGPNTGSNENGNVQIVNDGFNYPAVNQLIKVTIQPGS